MKPPPAASPLIKGARKLCMAKETASEKVTSRNTSHAGVVTINGDTREFWPNNDCKFRRWRIGISLDMIWTNVHHAVGVRNVD